MAFERILVPVDGSQMAEEALPHAIRFARVYQGRLFLLQVLDEHTGMVDHGSEEFDWRLHKIEAEAYLRALADHLIEQGIDTEIRITEGNASEQIVEFVRDLRIDLVVMSVYGRGGRSEFPFGSTIQKVIIAPETSVLVVRPMGMPTRQHNGYQRILVLLDGSRRAAWAVNLVSSIARSKGTELILLQVVEPPDMPRNRPFTSEETVLRNRLIESNRQAAACYLEEVKRQYSGTVEIRERLEISPHVVKTIEQVAASEDVDLIALTAHGASDITGRISGSVCQSLVLLASRPVLIVQDNPRRNHNRSRETTDGKIAVRMERNVGVG